jgi:hypothetical protein
MIVWCVCSVYSLTSYVNLCDIGERFRVKMRLPEWYSDEAVAQFLIQ